MRILLSILFLCTSLLTIAQERIPVHVTYISDGDTFWAVDAAGEKLKFRPIGFDCPEEANFGKPAEPYNEEATAYTTSLIYQKTVYIEYDLRQLDRYGRHLVYVWLEDGRLLNEEILRAGWAQLMTIAPNIKYVDRLRAAQQEGREQRKGVWRKNTETDK